MASVKNIYEINSLSKRNHLSLHFQSYLVCEANVKPWRILLPYLNNPTRRTRPWLQTLTSIGILKFRWSLFFRSAPNKRETHFSCWNQRVSRENGIDKNHSRTPQYAAQTGPMCGAAGLHQHLLPAAGGSGSGSRSTHTQTTKQPQSSPGLNAPKSSTEKM